MLARVVASVEGVPLGDAAALRCVVSDRCGRAGLAARVGDRLAAVLPLQRFRASGAACATTDVEVSPDCQNRQDALLVVLGLLSARVAELAGLQPMRSQGDAFVHDVRLAAATAFADLR